MKFRNRVEFNLLWTFDLCSKCGSYKSFWFCLWNTSMTSSESWNIFWYPSFTFLLLFFENNRIINLQSKFNYFVTLLGLIKNFYYYGIKIIGWNSSLWVCFEIYCYIFATADSLCILFNCRYHFIQSTSLNIA